MTFRNQVSGIYNFLHRYRLDHILFWLLYTFFWILVSGQITDRQVIANSAIVVAFQAVVSYFNIYVLVPLLLQKQRYVVYGISLILSILFTTFPIAFVFFKLNRDVAASADSIWSVQFFLIYSVGTAYAVAFTMVIRLMVQWYQREREKRELQRLNAVTELKYLKSQINPHFLFNSLNSIYSLTLKKSDEAPETVLKLSDMLRYLLYEAGEEKVIIEKEINYLKNYIELEKIRLGGRGSVVVDIQTDRDDYLIEPMLLIPFVENSFKHGLNSQATDAWLKCILLVANRQLHFTISNSKGKRSSRNTGYIGGIGLENVKKRLSILYPEKHKLEIKESEGVYEVLLDLELN